MRKPVRKWLLKITMTFAVIMTLLVAIVLDPALLYANKTQAGTYTIYHQQPISSSFAARLNDADKLLQKSELYTPLSLSVCMNDGSVYPRLMERIRGQAFGWGFAKIVVLMGHANADSNTVELNGYYWNLTELIAHEAMHCYQFHHYGLFHSKPIARIPEWKWEGYPEYVARQNKAGLSKNIGHLAAVEKTDNNNWISFDDSTGTVIPYYKSWLLVQYCMDVKKMTYAALLNDTTGESTVSHEMMTWYTRNSCN